MDESPADVWYCADPRIKGMFDRLAGLPMAYQRHIAGEICRCLRPNHANMDSLKSLGAQTILGIMKFRNPQYWFNRDTTVRNAVMGLPALPDQQKNEVLLRLGLSLATIEELRKRPDAPREETLKNVISHIFMRDTQDICRLTQRQSLNDRRLAATDEQQR